MQIVDARNEADAVVPHCREVWPARRAIQPYYPTSPDVCPRLARDLHKSESRGEEKESSDVCFSATRSPRPRRRHTVVPVASPSRHARLVRSPSSPLRPPLPPPPSRPARRRSSQSGSPPSRTPLRRASHSPSGSNSAHVRPTLTLAGVGTASCGTARSMHAATTRAAARTAVGESSHSNRSSSCICATRRAGSVAAVEATSACSVVVGFDSDRGRRGEPPTHRDLHQVRRAPLYERVDRLAFGLGAFAPLVRTRKPGRGRCRPDGKTTFFSTLARSFVRVTKARTPGRRGRTR